MRRSTGSLLRQASVLLLLFCLGAALAAPALAGPTPDPAPTRSQTPKPEAAPGVTAQPSRPSTTTRVPPRPAVDPPAPSSVVDAPPAPAQVQPPAPAQLERRPVRKRLAPKEKPARERTTKQTVRKVAPSLSRREPGSPDAAAPDRRARARSPRHLRHRLPDTLDAVVARRGLTHYERARSEHAAELLLPATSVTGPDVPSVAPRLQAVLAAAVRPGAPEAE